MLSNEIDFILEISNLITLRNEFLKQFFGFWCGKTQYYTIGSMFPNSHNDFYVKDSLLYWFFSNGTGLEKNEQESSFKNTPLQTSNSIGNM